LLKIDREADREAFNKLMSEDPKRLMLKDRVSYIKAANIKYVNIPLEKRQQIADRFLQDHKNLIPRHMRDVSRLVAIIKACALLNFEYRERFEDTIFVNDDDILEGFRLYCKISKANELGLPPEIYRIYEKLKPHLEDKETGVNRKEFQTWYYDAFHKVIGRERATEILKTLDSVGLIVELPDPIDKRFLRYVLPERGVNENNVCLGGGVNTLADTPHPDYTYFSEGKEEVKG